MERGSFRPPDERGNEEEGIHFGNETASIPTGQNRAAVSGSRRVHHSTRRGSPTIFVGRSGGQGVITEERSAARVPGTSAARRPAHQLREDSAQHRRLRDLEAMAGRPVAPSRRRKSRGTIKSAQAREEHRRHRGMSRLPDAIFVVDTKKEQIAVDEARSSRFRHRDVDTNCDRTKRRRIRATTRAAGDSGCSRRGLPAVIQGRDMSRRGRGVRARSGRRCGRERNGPETRRAAAAPGSRNGSRQRVRGGRAFATRRLLREPAFSCTARLERGALHVWAARRGHSSGLHVGGPVPRHSDRPEPERAIWPRQQSRQTW